MYRVIHKVTELVIKSYNLSYSQVCGYGNYFIKFSKNLGHIVNVSLFVLSLAMKIFPQTTTSLELDQYFLVHQVKLISY